MVTKVACVVLVRSADAFKQRSAYCHVATRTSFSPTCRSLHHLSFQKSTHSH